MSGGFALLTCDEQIEELRECLTRPWLVPERVRRHEAGRLVNQMRRAAEFVAPLPTVVRSPDPDDDFLLALAQAGRSDYLVTGGKTGSLPLRTHPGARIITATDFARRRVGTPR
ncbi:MAG TPA: PIN domain-containing protein [Acetobacteraceae bacterium]|jgi:hypothetical protein